jgi:hypothetical protein
VVVDLVVPEDGLEGIVVSYMSWPCDPASAYLVTVTPEVVLGADVLVGVLGLLGLGRHVGLVLPVLEPQAVGVDTTEDDRGDDDAVLQESRSDFLNNSFSVRSRRVGSLSLSGGGQWEVGYRRVHTRWRACARGLW